MARVVSKTALLELVKGLRARDVRAALAANPKLLDVRDARGRNWLHVSCGVNVAQRKLAPSAAVKTADVLLAAGLELDSVAFREESFEATPLWYSIAWGRNFALAKHLLELGANPRYCADANFRSPKGVTPLHCLLKKGSDAKYVRMLIDHGARLDAPNAAGRTAATIIAGKRDPAHRRLAIEIGARPRA